MDAREAEDYIYASYMRASSRLGYSERDALKRHPELTRDIIRGLSGTPAVCVTGSKGKGSASLMISEAVGTGMRTGLMTSPHLVRFTERIRAGGKEIPGDDLAQCVSSLKPVFDLMQETLPPGRYISPMGIQTAAALSWFRTQNTQLNVLECGKGARYDDVNNAIHRYAVINSVFAEHTRELGDTVEDIAKDKSWVITEDTRIAYTAAQPPSVLDIISERADAMNADLKIYGEDFSAADVRFTDSGMEFSVSLGDDQYDNVKVPLLGAHQARNCALALAVADDVLPDFNIEKVKARLENIVWPGRMDILSRDPLAVMDNCINRASCGEVLGVLKELGVKDADIVIGIPDDKDFLGVAQAVAPIGRRIILTASKNPHYHFSE